MVTEDVACLEAHAEMMLALLRLTVAFLEMCDSDHFDSVTDFEERGSDSI